MKFARSGMVVLLSAALGLLVAAIGSASSSTVSSGTRVAYSGTLEGSTGLIVVDVGSRFHRRITQGKSWLPAWSPDGDRIAFSRDGDIWTVDANGGRERRLTNTSGEDMLAAWSPDGRWIAFVRVTYRPSSGDWKSVMVVSPNGRTLRRLARAPERNDLPWGHPTWSPDGQWIAFHTGWHAGTGALRVVHVSGRGERLLTDYPGRCGGLQYSDSQPSWSPDGRWIAFLRDEQAICVVRPDGSGLRRLTPEGTYWALAWSPDGRRIAYMTRVGIGVMNANGSAARFLTRGSNPAWSADGRRLAFMRGRIGSSVRDDLYVIRTDGRGERSLAQNAAFDVPAWSPS